MSTSKLLAGVSVLALIPTVVQAQDTSANPPASVAATDQDERPVAAVEEVIVTAQRREQRLQEVPLTLAVQSGEALEQAQITDTRDLAKVVPGLGFTMNGSWAQPSIRGVTSTSSQSGNDPNVAFYIDGVYHPNQQANVFELPDIDRIEVLKGPQGTLFGRNATGGAIMVWTEEPSFIFTGKASASVSAFSTQGWENSFKAFVTGPLFDDKLAFSLAGLAVNNSGYLEHINTGEQFGEVRSYTARGKLLFTPTANSKYTLTGYYLDRFDQATQVGQAWNGNTLGRAINPATPLPTNAWEVAFDRESLTDVEEWGVSLVAEWEFSAGTLQSITSYHDTLAQVVADVDNTAVAIAAADVAQTDKPFSQELTFASEQFGRISFITGLFYWVNESTFQNFFSGLNARVDTTAWAVFGEATFDITDRLSVIGGLRYSWEEKRAEGAIFSPIPGLEQVPDDIPLLGEGTWDDITPRVSVTYDLNDATNLYLTYSTGFKSGAFSPSSLQVEPADPESITAIEAGVKVWTPRYYYNLSAFKYDYTDLQVQYFNGLVSIVTNAADAKLAGVDFDGAVDLTDNFNIRAAISWLPEAEYETFLGAPINVPTGSGGNTGAVIDASGNRLIKAPEVTASLTGAYTWRLSDADVRASLTAFHSSEVALDTSGRVHSDPYTTLAGELAYEPIGSNWRVALFGKNLTNEEYINGQAANILSDYVTYAPPRQIGVQFGVKF